MNLERVQKIADAVFYEGYMLYPYRPSAIKNQQRWNFGVLCPPAYCRSQGGAETSSSQTEVLVQGAPSATLSIRVRFLQIIQRSVCKMRHAQTSVSPRSALHDGPDNLEFVSHLEVDGRIYQPWQEAVERAIAFDATLMDLSVRTPSLPIAFPAQTEREQVRDADGHLVGAIVREWKSLAGSVEVAVTNLKDDLFKVTVRICNRTVFDTASNLSREEVIPSSMVSAHVILGLESGGFFSLLDPPMEFAALAAECKNVGTWPVLAGEDEAREAMLSSPIILYDYPQIAAESAGSLFDSTEIDEILSLRIMTLTDDEKREIRQSDDRAREILDRTENMPPEQFMKLHGALRGLQATKGDVR